MQFIPVKTKVMEPPQEDLYSVLDASVPEVENGDIICISSKVVAIHQGRTVRIGEADKAELVGREADHLIQTDYHPFPLTIKFNTFLGAAGIDESNGNGYYILPPERVFETAAELHRYFKNRHDVTDIGVIITDSRSLPFRFGAMGVSIACWGFSPIASHVGKKDLFGREIRFERSNLADGIAAAANLVSGEVAECQPVVIARGVPEVVFGDGDRSADLMVKPAEDIFRVLYERFLK